MVSRSMLALFAIALIAASVNAAPAEEFDDFDLNDDLERGIKEWLSENAKVAAEKIAKEVMEFFKKEAKKVNFDCVKEIYKSCEINPLKHPKKYYKCAKNYFLEHKEECYHDE